MIFKMAANRTKKECSIVHIYNVLSIKRHPKRTVHIWCYTCARSFHSRVFVIVDKHRQVVFFSSFSFCLKIILMLSSMSLKKVSVCGTVTTSNHKRHTTPRRDDHRHTRRWVHRLLHSSFFYFSFFSSPALCPQDKSSNPSAKESQQSHLSFSFIIHKSKHNSKEEELLLRERISLQFFVCNRNQRRLFLLFNAHSHPTVLYFVFLNILFLYISTVSFLSLSLLFYKKDSILLSSPPASFTNKIKPLWLSSCSTLNAG